MQNTSLLPAAVGDEGQAFDPLAPSIADGPRQ